MQNDILLMVDPVGDQIAPVSRRAFSVIAAPVARFLARNCVALFLDKDGAVTRIEDVALGNRNLPARIGLWFGLPVSARFQFEPVEATLEDMKTMIQDAMVYTRARGASPNGWWLLSAPEAEVAQSISAATTLAELHASIRFPSDRDCLDLL